MSSFETNLYLNTSTSSSIGATALNFTAPQGKYETTAQGTYILNFIDMGTGGFSSTPATFPALANQPSGQPDWVQTPLLSTTSQGRPDLQIPFQNSVTTLQRAGLIIHTLAGSFDDPTIVNNPDKDG